MKIWVPYAYGMDALSDLPVTVEFYPSPEELPSDPTTVDFWVPPFLASGPVVAMIDKLPSVRVIQLLSAGADAWIGRVPDGVSLCDARGVHNSSTAEWALTAILSYQRAFPAFARAQFDRRWSIQEYAPTDEVTGKQVLIVGAGAIGEALATRLVACEASVTRVARSARDGVYGVDDLPELLPQADIVVLIVPLTALTRGMVDAAFLARMRDGALLVNAARGPVVVTDALVAELATGRLNAAMDVTDPEPLPPDHPLWMMPNALITPHVAGTVKGLMPRAFGLVADQVRRRLAGEPLINLVTGDY